LHKFALSRNPELHELITVIGQMLDAGCWINRYAPMVASRISSIQNPETRISLG